MRPLAPLELWLLAHSPTPAQRRSLVVTRAPIPNGPYGWLRLRPPLTQAELWDKLIAESGMERMRVEAMAA